MRSYLAILGTFLIGGTFRAGAIGGAHTVDFNRDIRPVFVNTCFKCHGPGAHNSDTKFRLYSKAGAFVDLGGYQAIIPGNPDQSPLYQHITSKDPDKHMPPPDSGLKLTGEQIKLIHDWIQQGADWETYWAFEPVRRPDPPAVKDPHWVRNPIDNFVLARLEKAGLTASPEADKRTLIRRVTLDLTGLPPTPADVREFVNDTSPMAYENLVERLLASPHYGEQMARHWLDAARYGDSHGMHFDNIRSIWPYRDWVVRAFNENLPFNDFTIDQLAGDLLPNPTRDELIGSGFNRCNITSNEGGSIPEELWVRYTKDRAMTTGTVWLGLTVGCAQCHNHKYDPIKQKDFYDLYAFFYNMADKPMDGNVALPEPFLKLPTPAQDRQMKKFDEEIASVQQTIKEKVAAVSLPAADESESDGLERREYVWIDDHPPEGTKTRVGDKEADWPAETSAEDPVYSGARSFELTAEEDKRNQLIAEDAKVPLRVGKGDRLFAYVYLDPKNPPQEIMLQFNDGNWEHRAFWGKDLIDWGKKDTASRRIEGALPEPGQWERLEVSAKSVGFSTGSQVKGWAFTVLGGNVYWDKAGIDTQTPQQGKGFGSFGDWLAWQKVNQDKSLPKNIQDALKAKPDKRSKDQVQHIRDYFVENDYEATRAEFAPLHQKLAGLESDKKKLDAMIPGTLISRQRDDPREAHLLDRGAYDVPKEVVHPDIPAFLNPWPADAPRNRLGLAEWLMDPDNPLPARVTVNRYWQQYFGRGLVKTAENFGALGDLPSHPELLDWLASEFVRSGWDIKHIQRLIVTSATYRQSSRTTPELREKDPQNILLSRGPHYRLDAEEIRDYALFVSGLLVDKLGGEPVHPYQPLGLWKAIAYVGSNTMLYKKDEGPKLYRRSLYTFWKRTLPPPDMTAFDIPSREECTVRRDRTDTPLQALVLMDDVQYVEAARHLAERLMTEGGLTPNERISFAFSLVLSRPPDSGELKIMRNLYEQEYERFTKDTDAANSLIHEGDSPPNADLAPASLAAWTVIGNAMLNLSETVSKR